MKRCTNIIKIKLFFLLLIISNFGYSQNKTILIEEENDDSLLIKNFEEHDAKWAGISVGINTLLDKGFSRTFENFPEWKNSIYQSIHIEINLIDYKIPIKNELGMITGLGFSMKNYTFSDNWTLHEKLNEKTGSTGYVTLDTNEFNTNKLQCIHITTPILLEYTIKQKSWLQVGFILGYKLSSSTTQTIIDKNRKSKTTLKGSFGLNSLSADAIIRLGHEDWGVFGSYNVTSLFNQKTMPYVSPLTVGISFNY
jgi:hypothetical protein